MKRFLSILGSIFVMVTIRVLVREAIDINPLVGILILIGVIAAAALLSGDSKNKNTEQNTPPVTPVPPVPPEPEVIEAEQPEPETTEAESEPQTIEEEQPESEPDQEEPQQTDTAQHTIQEPMFQWSPTDNAPMQKEPQPQQPQMYQWPPADLPQMQPEVPRRAYLMQQVGQYPDDIILNNQMHDIPGGQVRYQTRYQPRKHRVVYLGWNSVQGMTKPWLLELPQNVTQPMDVYRYVQQHEPQWLMKM